MSFWTVTRSQLTLSGNVLTIETDVLGVVEAASLAQADTQAAEIYPGFTGIAREKLPYTRLVQHATLNEPLERAQQSLC